MHIERQTAVTDELVEAFRRLMPQLSSSNSAPARRAGGDDRVAGHHAARGPQ